MVRNVKKAHQIQEIGEFQEFNDDVEYILDALQDNNPISTRCLSAITLASKCMVPAFRMHVRAHGTVAKFFKALHDATIDQVQSSFEAQAQINASVSESRPVHRNGDVRA